jgi:hypothetical protein
MQRIERIAAAITAIGRFGAKPILRLVANGCN